MRIRGCTLCFSAAGARQKEKWVHCCTWPTRGSRSASEPRFKATHHGNGVGGQQLLGTHGCDVGDVGEDVDEGHQGDGDEDGARKVPGNGERRKHEAGIQGRK